MEKFIKKQLLEIEDAQQKLISTIKDGVRAQAKYDLLELKYQKLLRELRELRSEESE